MNFTFEMYPVTSAQGGFYPGDEIIAAQTGRNRTAILYLLDKVDCSYKVIGKEGQYCNRHGDRSVCQYRLGDIYGDDPQAELELRGTWSPWSISTRAQQDSPIDFLRESSRTA